MKQETLTLQVTGDQFTVLCNLLYHAQRGDYNKIGDLLSGKDWNTIRQFNIFDTVRAI